MLCSDRSHVRYIMGSYYVLGALMGANGNLVVSYLQSYCKIQISQLGGRMRVRENNKAV